MIFTLNTSALKKHLIAFLLIVFTVFMLASCGDSENKLLSYRIKSPSGNLKVSFLLSPGGTPGYAVHYKDKIVVDSSSLGFTLKDAEVIKHGFRMASLKEDTLNENWEQPWGEQRKMNNRCTELTIELVEKEKPKRTMFLIFRAYDDAAAFRYYFPEQENVKEMVILEENTRFQIRNNPTTWWTPGDWDISEHLYTKSNLNKINAIAKRGHPSLGQTYIPENAVSTPFTLRFDDGLHVAFHEAALIDYADMTLKVDTNAGLLSSSLVGSDRLGYKVKRTLPFKSPWRVILVNETAAGLADSRTILNLNEPNKLGDVSYVKPMKYAGIWWEMHLGKSSWDKASGKHGATTKHARELIDFAAENNLKGVLVEGWNTGWERWIGFEDREGVFDFVTPYDDYNLDEVVTYAKSKGVEIIMHHETSSAPRTYEKQMEAAFKLMQKHGLTAVKTGYVGKIIPKGEYHHGQWMVNHYQKVIELAAKYRIAVNAHEPIKDTGLRRTYPNFITREGMRGQEFNAWSADGGNPPDHIPSVAFTRMLAGPFDFTPGVFNISLKPYKNENQVNTTLAQQLGLYVVLYSPLQMACDLPEYYQGNPAFQFIRDVGVDWEQSLTLDGRVGEYVVSAREERGTGNWFVGAANNEEARDVSLDFGFLPEGKTFQAIIYSDAPDADYQSNPTAYKISKQEIRKGEKLTLRMARGGGFAISLKQ
jgi:hypothetical protein